MSVMGQIPDTLLGLGAAGIVTRVGSAVSKFQVGDRVSMIGRGAHRTVLRSRAQYCELIPHSMSFQEASIVPSVHATAWYGLVQLARVKKGQSILVHAAAGGVGQAAMQIAKHFGMTIFATVDSDIKRELVREVYQIPNDHILDSQDLSFAKSIKRMTDGRGVDVVLNSSSTGEALRQTWYCIAPFGHFLEVGLKDILGNTELDMRPFLRNATFTYFSLDDIAEGAVETMAEILDGTWDFQRRGITKPISPVTTHPISDVVKAFKLVQTDKYVGDVVLTWSDEISVPVIQSSKASSLRLDPNAAYLLVGGLGGLGRSISTVLADLGARKLCFLSRSGDDSPQAQSLVVDLRERKVDVKIYVCDVANEKAVVNATRRCTQELGKIKGVFQCAMVLRDALFTNMTHRDWVEATRPKVQGSWNLHNQLKEVDFFITLSSFAAVIGNRGQGNYAAAGAYEDTLSYYRRARGMHAVTIDLGIMRDIGVLAENGMVDAFRDWEKPYGMCVADFHALIKQAMFGDINQDIAPQILTGIATGGSAIDAGIASPFYLEDARFAIMAATDLEMNCADGGGLVSTENRISQAGSLEEASQVVEEVLVLRIAQILQTPTSEIDTGRFLHSYGIDSLVAIEVVNWALKEIKSSITVFDVMAGIPITTTATKIAMRSARLPTELLPPS
jgi:NADPH:quinone reductase-like Zn-dependent oxidoreductase